MKAQSRILAIILSLTFVLPFGIFANASESTEAVASVADNKYYNMLVSFGIIDEADGLEGAQYVTRSQLAKYAVSLFGPDVSLGQGEGAELPFNDIDGDTNADAIVELYNRGLISGTAPGQFSPDDEVTMGQAAKIFVTALGYEKLAVNRGGYPMGYVTVASRLDILDGVSADVNNPMETGAFIRMLFNALSADVVQLEGAVETAEEIYELSNAYEGESVLSKYYDIYEYEGILDSNEYTSLHGQTELAEGRVSINNIVFKTGATGAYNLLGYEVECYYTDSDSDLPKLLYAGINERDNEVYVVDGLDVVADSLSLTSFAYYDEENKKEYQFDISPVAVLIYNGKQQEMSTTYMCPQNGEVTLIDNNDDGKMDVLKVENYQSMYVAAKADSTYTLVGENGIVLALESDVEEYGFHIEMDGRSITFEEIPENSIVSFAKPLDLSTRYLKQVRVSTKKVEGSIDSVYTSENEASVDGVWYDFLPSLSLTVGTSGTFYLDFKGVIVHREEEKDFVYGYLYKIGEMKSRSIKDIYGARLLSEKGNWVELEFDERVKSGSSRLDADDFYAAYGTRANEIVRYSVTDEGKIKEMHFAQSAEWFTDAHMTLIEQEAFHSIANLTDVEYYTSAATFEGLVGLTNDTVIFYLPPGYDGVNNEDAIEVVSKSELRNNTDYPSVTAYDINRGGAAAVAAIESTAEYSASSGLVPVKSVVVCNNSEGEEVYGIRGYFSGSEIMTVCVRNDDALGSIASTLKEGDIIRCSINKNNEIISLEKLFTKASYGTQTWGGSASSRLVSGSVESIDYTQKKLVVNSGSTYMFSAESVGSVWVYDMEDKEFRPGTFTDVQKGDFLYMRAGSFVVREIIVYK